MKERFDLILDPTDLWTVWDNEADEPAVYANQLLAGLTRNEAETAHRALVEMTRRSEEATKKPAKKDAAA